MLGFLRWLHKIGEVFFSHYKVNLFSWPEDWKDTGLAEIAIHPIGRPGLNVGFLSLSRWMKIFTADAKSLMIGLELFHQWAVVSRRGVQAG